MKRYYILACLCCFSGICSSSDDEIGLVIDPETSRDGKGIEHSSALKDDSQNANKVNTRVVISEPNDDLAASIAPKRQNAAGLRFSDK